MAKNQYRKAKVMTRAMKQPTLTPISAGMGSPPTVFAPSFESGGGGGVVVGVGVNS